MEDTVVFPTRKMFNFMSVSIFSFINKKSASHFRKETAKENKLLKETKTLICNSHL